MSETAQKPDNTGDLQEKRDAKGRFPKGVSGNPKGKPRGSISVVAKIKEELAKTPKGQKAPYLESLVRQILKKAIEEGNESMIKLIVSYVDGMPKQSVDLDVRPKLILDDETEEQRREISNMIEKSEEDIKEVLRDGQKE